MITVYTLSSITCVLLAAALAYNIKKAKSSLLISILTMLIVVNICVCLFNKSNQTFRIILCSQPGIPIEVSQIKTQVWMNGIYTFVSLVLYTLAHWLFAYKYWYLGYVLTQHSQKIPTRVNIAMIAGIIGA